MQSKQIFDRMSQLPATIQLQRSQLNAKARADFDHWRALIEPLLALPVRGIWKVIEALSTRCEIPAKTIYKRYRACVQRGLIALVDRRLAGPGWWKTVRSVSLSPEDIELVRLYCLRNQRSTRAACKQLRRDFLAGKVKTSTPLHPLTRMPSGWSIGNLAGYAPPVVELKAARIGFTAAKSERPTVITTRKGLWKMSHVMIDDMWHNFMVNTFAENQAGRPLELFSHDLYSARKVRWGVRVRTRKDDGSYNQLTERMTRMTLAATFFLDGYSPRGTQLSGIEHGTAAVPEWLERALRDMSMHDGRPLITVNRAGLSGARAHWGQYSGLVRGNPNAKASLESSNNNTQNVFAHLPGQVGKDIAHRPEEMHGAGPVFRTNADGQRVMVREGGLLWHNQCLLAARRFLSPEKAAKLEFPLMELSEFHDVAQELYAGIEQDQEHDLNDWVECGFIRQQMLLGDQWVFQEDVVKTPQHAELLAQMIEAGTVPTRPRRMSRRQVWDAGGELIRIPGHGVVSILGDDLGVERRVMKNRFEFEDAEVGPGEHRFHAVCVDAYGERIRLSDRDTYETFVNPFAPDTLFVRNADGSYVGECARDTAPSRADVEASERKMGEVAKTATELLMPLRKTMMKDDRKVRQQRTNNDVLGGNAKAAASAQSREEKRVSGVEGSLSEFLDEAAPDAWAGDAESGGSLRDFLDDEETIPN